MNARVLSAITSIALLAGCSSGTSTSTGTNLPFLGIGKLPVELLAVTSADPETGTVSSVTHVTWPAQPGAKIYEVSRQFGTDALKVVASPQTPGYDDTSLSAGQSATYTIRALDGNNVELNASDSHSVTVLAQTVAKATGLTPADNATVATGDKVTFAWTAVPSASYYYVKVTKVSDGSTAYSAMTKSPTCNFGDAAAVSFSSFGTLPQFQFNAAGGISRGLVYEWSVEAIRPDTGSTPDDAKAVDISTSATQKFSQD